MLTGKPWFEAYEFAANVAAILRIETFSGLRNFTHGEILVALTTQNA
jgi:hypothetical protein